MFNLMSLILQVSVASAPCLTKQQQDVLRIESHINRHANIGYSHKLALSIYKVSRKHNINQRLLTQIMLVESRGNVKAYNRKTKDHGLMQVNDATAKAYGFSRIKLYEADYALNAGATVLADLKKYKGYRPCMYNLGPRVLKGERLKKCLLYEKKLAKFN